MLSCLINIDCIERRSALNRSHGLSLEIGAASVGASPFGPKQPNPPFSDDFLELEAGALDAGLGAVVVVTSLIFLYFMDVIMW